MKLCVVAQRLKHQPCILRIGSSKLGDGTESYLFDLTFTDCICLPWFSLNSTVMVTQNWGLLILLSSIKNNSV